MSRIGRKPIGIPEGVNVQHAGGEVRVQGPKGQLSQHVPPKISVEIADGEVRFSRPNDRKQNRALHGLARALVANMIAGVTEGFRKELQIEGVGYRADLQGQKLTLTVGRSHPVVVQVPADLKVSVEASTRIRVEGIDREQVGQFAADLRAVRPPEPYKGKGIRYVDERVRRKVGKAGAATG
jgi:large subunit ribosomal protein L6